MTLKKKHWRKSSFVFSKCLRFMYTQKVFHLTQNLRKINPNSMKQRKI